MLNVKDNKMTISRFISMLYRSNNYEVPNSTIYSKSWI